MKKILTSTSKIMQVGKSHDFLKKCQTTANIQTLERYNIGCQLLPGGTYPAVYNFILLPTWKKKNVVPKESENLLRTLNKK